MSERLCACSAAYIAVSVHQQTIGLWLGTAVPRSVQSGKTLLPLAAGARSPRRWTRADVSAPWATAGMKSLEAAP